LLIDEKFWVNKILNLRNKYSEAVGDERLDIKVSTGRIFDGGAAGKAMLFWARQTSDTQTPDNLCASRCGVLLKSTNLLLTYPAKIFAVF
jgi:hypothetical protein